MFLLNNFIPLFKITKMDKLKYIVIVFVCFISCKTNEEKDTKKPNTTERAIEKALLNGYFAQINEKMWFSIYQDNIFYFSTKPEGFTKDKFLLHFIKEDNSFDNNDFFKDKYVLSDSLKGAFSSLEIIKREFNVEPYRHIRTGQFKRNKDLSTTNNWVKVILVKDILESKENYSNQFTQILNKNLLNSDFIDDLNSGKFFKTKSDLYILLTDTNIFFIAINENAVKEGIMLHFIKSKQDNTFKNLSFNFKDKEYQQFLEPPYSNLKIAKINIPFGDEYKIIRIGQYNLDGNIWAQRIELKDIYENGLLIYQNEFKE